MPIHKPESANARHSTGGLLYKLRGAATARVSLADPFVFGGGGPTLPNLGRRQCVTTASTNGSDRPSDYYLKYIGRL